MRGRRRRPVVRCPPSKGAALFVIHGRRKSCVVGDKYLGCVQGPRARVDSMLDSGSRGVGSKPTSVWAFFRYCCHAVYINQSSSGGVRTHYPTGTSLGPIPLGHGGHVLRPKWLTCSLHAAGVEVNSHAAVLMASC